MVYSVFSNRNVVPTLIIWLYTQEQRQQQALRFTTMVSTDGWP